MPSSRLAAAAGVLIACALASSAEAQTVPPPDLVYSRIKPCRIFDTTKTAKIPANSAKSFLIAGSGNFAAQGGVSAGCGVPASAQAVSINLSAINGAAAGSLTAMPYAQTTSTTTIRYPVSAPETVGGIVDLLQNRITLRTTNTVNAMGDVTGYYAPAIVARKVMTRDAADNFIVSFDSGPRVLSAHRMFEGEYEFKIDRDVSACFVLTPANGYAVGTLNSVVGDTVTLSTFKVATGQRTDDGTITLHVVC